MAKENDIWWRLRLLILPWLEDALVHFLWEQGIQGVQVLEEENGHICLIAYVPYNQPVRELENRLNSYSQLLETVHGEKALIGWEVDGWTDVDWREAWKTHFHISRISRRFVVKPSWESYEPAQETHVLEIDPGQAFGTGLHPSTRLCLDWIDQLIDQGPRVARALDVGTGTGILAIALAKLGVAEIVALDIDPLAVDAARRNVRINGVADHVVLFQGSVDMIGKDRFDLVVANLTAKMVGEMAASFGEHLTSRGRLLVSGILEEERDLVGETFKETNWGFAGESLREGWCALVFEQKG